MRKRLLAAAVDAAVALVLGGAAGALAIDALVRCSFGSVGLYAAEVLAAGAASAWAALAASLALWSRTPGMAVAGVELRGSGHVRRSALFVLAALPARWGESVVADESEAAPGPDRVPAAAFAALVLIGGALFVAAGAALVAYMFAKGPAR